MRSCFEMKKQTLTLILAIFLISFISAVNIYSGESEIIILDKPFAYYSIVGNSTLINLTITQNGNEVNVTLGKYNLNDTFEIVFFDKEKETITIYSSGGGSSTKYVDKEIIEYVEVPTYITKDKIIEVEREIEKEIEKEKIIEKIPFAFLIFTFFLLIGVLIFLDYIFNKVDKVYRDERRLENNGRTEENF
jgi:hypothetical protein